MLVNSTCGLVTFHSHSIYACYGKGFSKGDVVCNVALFLIFVFGLRVFVNVIHTFSCIFISYSKLFLNSCSRINLRMFVVCNKNTKALTDTKAASLSDFVVLYKLNQKGYHLNVGSADSPSVNAKQTKIFALFFLPYIYI